MPGVPGSSLIRCDLQPAVLTSLMYSALALGNWRSQRLTPIAASLAPRLAVIDGVDNLGKAEYRFCCQLSVNNQVPMS